MPAHMTFQPGAVLEAAHLNDACNPTTAAHIPYAVATGIVRQTQSGSQSINVQFPIGRFSKKPVLTFGIESASGAVNWNAVRFYSLSTSGFTAFLNSGDGAEVHWIAIQMDA